MKMNRRGHRGHRERRKKLKLCDLSALRGEKIFESTSQPMAIHKIKEKR